MAAVVNITAPLGQIVQTASPAQKLHARQLVRLFKDVPTTNPVKACFTTPDIFKARWLVEENSSLSRPEEFFENANEVRYPAHWLTVQGATNAVANFRGFANLLPGWGPLVITRGNNPVQSQFNLRIEVLGRSEPEQPWSPSHRRIKHMVGTIADTAFALLSSPRSLQKLQEMFTIIRDNWNERGIDHCVSGGANSQIVVNHFLTTLQARFPTLKLVGHKDRTLNSDQFHRGLDKVTRSRTSILKHVVI
ncbi:hypothetical protein N5P37_006363 [Trichoderma harzianum]|nr:hypothetical protein N5P37_006363 [Trichoderma harzianum]